MSGLWMEWRKEVSAELILGFVFDMVLAHRRLVFFLYGSIDVLDEGVEIGCVIHWIVR